MKHLFLLSSLFIVAPALLAMDHRKEDAERWQRLTEFMKHYGSIIDAEPEPVAQPQKTQKKEPIPQSIIIMQELEKQEEAETTSMIKLLGLCVHNK